MIPVKDGATGRATYRPNSLERYVVGVDVPVYGLVLMLHNDLSSGNACSKVLSTLVSCHVFDWAHPAHFPAVPATFSVFLQLGFQQVHVTETRRGERAVLTLHRQ